MLMWVMSDRAIPRSYAHDAGLRRAHLPARERRGRVALRASSTGSRKRARIRWSGTRRSRSPAPIRTSIAATCGKPSRRASTRSGSSACRSSPRNRPTGFSFDVLDATKIVPEELVPVTPVGRMVLNRNPDNFFAETEQVAFCTAHVVPGIDFSNDPLLAGRIHSYVDTQITRLGGPNFHEIPINAPIAPVHNNQRDGLHRQAIPRGRVAYEPNSLGRRLPVPGRCQRDSSRSPQPMQRGQAARQAGEVRRSLHAGDAVLRQPDRVGEGAHRRRLPLRAQQGHGAGDPRARWSRRCCNVSPQDLAAQVAEGWAWTLPEPTAARADEPAQSQR